MAFDVTSSPPLRRFRRGGMLLGLIIVVLALSISLGVVAPRATLAVKRAKEDELRFILGEYRRGIEKFQARRKRNPQQLEELLRDEKGIPYIRRLYPDPISGKSDWILEVAGDQAFIRSNSSATSLAGVPYSAFR